MILSKIYKKHTFNIGCMPSVNGMCNKKRSCRTRCNTGQMQSDVYTGTDTVEYLADGVPDRVFFATNETILTTASRETLRAQAAWLRKNSNIKCSCRRTCR